MGGIKSFGKALEKAVQDVGKTLEKAGQDVGKTAERVGKELGREVKDVGDFVHDATHAHKAPKMNREARLMSENAIKEVEDKYNEVENAAIDLANVENKIKASFSEFQDLLEKIHNRPDIKSEIDKISVPGADFPKVHSSYIDIAKFTIAGVVLFAPTPISIPLVLITGALTYRKAEKNLEKAQKIVDDSQKVLDEYEKLKLAIEKMHRCVFNLKKLYDREYEKLYELVVLEKKFDYRLYSDEEKVILYNTVKFVQILVTLFKTTMKEKKQSSNDSDKQTDENTVELELSEDKINQAVDNAENALKIIQID